MVIPKYTAEESLERIKLMMKYNNSTTLSENKIIIFENNEPVEKAVNDFNSEIAKIMTDEHRVVDIITSLGTSDNFELFIKKIGGLKLFLGKIKSAFGAMDKYEIQKLTRVLSKFGYSLKTPHSSGNNYNVNYSISKIGSGGETKTKQSQNNSKDTQSQNVSKYKLCKGTSEDPFKLYCSETQKNGPLHKVQTCLGVKPDGKFGPKTEAALRSAFTDKQFHIQFTVADIPTICKKTPTPEPPKPEPPKPEPPKPEDEDLGNYSPDDIQ
jgi:hypothetical protein